jgi:hypothetical protein
MKRHLLYAMLSLAWQPALAQDWRQVIPGFSDLQRSPSLPKDYAESLTELLLPAAEWKAERLSFANESSRAYQVTYGKGGIVTVDRVMTKGNCRFSINIASPTSARIRHQIMIGTDMAEWEIVRRDPPSSEGQPFARTYFLRLPNSGRLRGLAFYEGTWAELDPYHAWESVRIAAGTQTVDGPYVLRHSCVTLFVKAKVPVPEIAAFTGMTIAVLERYYLHQTLADQENIAQTTHQKRARNRSKRA